MIVVVEDGVGMCGGVYVEGEWFVELLMLNGGVWCIYVVVAILLLIRVDVMWDSIVGIVVVVIIVIVKTASSCG